MRPGALLFSLAAAACASAPAPAGKIGQDDDLARIPDVPPSEVAERIVKAQGLWGVTDTFTVVEVNLQSADNTRVRSALAVLEAMATSLDRLTAKDDAIDGYGQLVNHIRTVLDRRLETAPCSLVFAVEHAAGEFNHLRGYVPPIARHGSTEKHELSLRTISCVITSMKERAAACHAKPDATVDIVVSEQGIVTSAVAKGELANTPTGDCVAAAVKGVTFPPSDEVITLTYPRY